jgi:hypothetical protein
VDYIKTLNLIRRVEREAGRWGYSGDVTTDEDRVPLVGSYREQMAIATIGRDCSPGPMSTRDRALLNRLVRAAVLTSVKVTEVKSYRPCNLTGSTLEAVNGKLARERRRAG